MIVSIIEKIVAQKQGNKEFVLHRFEDGSWRAEIGNKCEHVTLGECGSDFQGEGETAESACDNLLSQLPHPA